MMKYTGIVVARELARLGNLKTGDQVRMEDVTSFVGEWGGRVDAADVVEALRECGVDVVTLREKASIVDAVAEDLEGLGVLDAGGRIDEELALLSPAMLEAVAALTVPLAEATPQATHRGMYLGAAFHPTPAKKPAAKRKRAKRKPAAKKPGTPVKRKPAAKKPGAGKKARKKSLFHRALGHAKRIAKKAGSSVAKVAKHAGKKLRAAAKHTGKGIHRAMVPAAHVHYPPLRRA